MRALRTLLLVLTVSAGLAASPALAGGPITSGSTVAGSVTSPTFSESWTFSGTAGQRVLITAVTTSGAMNTNIFLKAPGGGTETSTSSDRIDWPLAATGTYTIAIEDLGLNDVGTYNLCFVNVTAGPLTSAGDMDGGAIVSADVKTGTMSGVADMDAFTFSGTNGQRVLIDAVETAGAGFNTVIYLYPPGGGAYALWSVGGNRADFQLTATGTWVIVIEDYGNDLPGSYSMSFLNVTAGPHTSVSDTDGSAIASNEIKTGQFQQGVDFDAFTFSGTAGNRIFFAGIATGGGTHNTQISIYPPGGGVAEVSTSSDRIDHQLLMTGTYTAVIEDAGNDNAGTYTMSFLNATVGPYTDGSDMDGGAIVSAEVKTGTMSGPADIDAFTFSGTNGQRVLIDAVETAGAGFNTVIYLYPPGGGSYALWSVGGNRADFQLTATGTWVIVIEDYGNDLPGSYSMSFLNVTAGPHTSVSDTDGSAIASNEIKTGQFQQGVDFDAFTFSGTAGNRIFFAGIATGGGTHNTQITIFPPSGGVAEVSTSSDRIDHQLLMTGTYTAVIEDAGNDNAGTYSISYFNATAGPFTNGGDLDGGAIVSAEVKTGTMSGPADIDAFSFSGTNGQRVLIDAVETAGAGFNTVIYLYPPGGGSYALWSVGGNRADFQLTATGTWVIVIEDYGNDLPGSYSMSFLNVTAGPHTSGADTDGSAIASNEIKTGQFQQGVDFDAFTFAGTAGNRIFFAGIATGGGTHNTQISIFPPGGGVAEVSTSSDRIDHQLLMTGTYTAVIEDAGNDNAGTYTISFFNATAGPYTDGSDMDGGPILSAEVKTGTMSGPADIDAFTFSGTNGQRVLIDAVETAGTGFNTVIYLYPPGGGSYALWSVGGNRADFQLTATGTWVIVIEDYGNDLPGNYSMSFLNVTVGPHTSVSDTDGSAIASNEIKTGQFQQGVDFDVYPFFGSFGNRVIVAGIAKGGGGHNTQMSIYPPGGGPAEISTSSDRLDHQLATSGNYRIVIEDAGNDNAGAYSVSFFNVTAGPFANAGDPTGGPLTSNAIVSGTMSAEADVDGFIFSGTNGQRILIGAVETAGAGFNTVIYLYPPGGGTYALWSVGGNRADFQLTATGTWAIIIEDYGNDLPGSYNMSFLNVTNGPYSGSPESDGGFVTPTSPANGSAFSDADFDGYVFSAESGDMANITATTTSGAMNTQISLYPPGGGAALVSTSTDNVNQMLSASGIYTIVIEDAGQDTTGNYTLTLSGSGDATGIPDGAIDPAPILSLALAPASPSPFVTATRLDFQVASAGPVRLRVFDVAGARVRSLVDRSLAPGRHPMVWDGRDDRGQRVASGVYYVRLEADGQVRRQKVVALR